MLRNITALLMVLLAGSTAIAQPAARLKFYPSSDSRIRFTGRVDHSNPALPRFWNPGVYCSGVFAGDSALLIVNDEVLYGTNHNYVSVVVDDAGPQRLQLTGKSDTVVLRGRKGLSEHRFLFCKSTESNIGYLEIAGILCEQLLTPGPRPSRKIEFIGNSITCGAGSDLSGIPCGKGKWHDQHNAYNAYGPTTARSLQAEWQLTAVSGIGLMKSCCGLNITMPQVFDKVHLSKDTIRWNFNHYQPDVVTVCLGQNDGIQDSVQFCSKYGSFLKTLRQYYPAAQLICLNSPMADGKLNEVLSRHILAVRKKMNEEGDKKISHYFFSKTYNQGCDWHPNLGEHAAIADELTKYIRTVMNW